MSDKKILGIIGGMGPAATVQMFLKIVKLTGAKYDQDHIEIIIHNNTKIPDRTKAILEGVSSPLDELLRSARMLDKLSVHYIIMPCMTSHYYINDLQQAINTPIINAIKETANFIFKNYPTVTSVGLLATSGTIKAGLFQNQLMEHQISTILLPKKHQNKLVMEALYGEKGVKAGFSDGTARQHLINAANILIEHGAKALIAGCTEIPLVISQKDFKIPLINPVEVLAHIAILRCLGKKALR